MNLEQYEKLKESYENVRFTSKYTVINKFLIAFSYFGHLSSIFLGYFFIQQLLFQIVGDELHPLIINGLSVLFLTLFELLKRYLFDRFSFDAVTKKFKKWTGETWTLLVSTLIIVSISFYFGLSGAEKFSDKSKKINLSKDSLYVKAQDSLQKVWKPELDRVQKRLSEFESRIKASDEIIAATSAKLNDPNLAAWSASGLRSQIDKERQAQKSLREDERMAKAERDSAKVKFDKELAQVLSKIDDGIKSQSSDAGAAQNKFMFIILFIEFIILIGILFENYHAFNLYQEISNDYHNDPKYGQWKIYKQILPIIFQNGSLHTGDKALSGAKVIEIVKMENPNITEKNIRDLSNILSYLGIVETQGNFKVIKLELEDAIEKVKNYMQVEA